MFGTALVVFREVLEAALIVGIVAAATRGIAGRGRWIASGITAGIVGSLLVAASAEAISTLAEGMGQELFNASILGVAVAMLAWHNIWMSVHGRQLASHAGRVMGTVAAEKRHAPDHSFQPIGKRLALLLTGRGGTTHLRGVGPR